MPSIHIGEKGVKRNNLLISESTSGRNKEI
jgi:hypothetical protein